MATGPAGRAAGTGGAAEAAGVVVGVVTPGADYAGGTSSPYSFSPSAVKRTTMGVAGGPAGAGVGAAGVAARQGVDAADAAGGVDGGEPHGAAITAA